MRSFNCLIFFWILWSTKFINKSLELNAAGFYYAPMIFSGSLKVEGRILED